MTFACKTLMNSQRSHNSGSIHFLNTGQIDQRKELSHHLNDLISRSRIWSPHLVPTVATGKPQLARKEQNLNG